MGWTIEASSFDSRDGQKYLSTSPRLDRLCDPPSLYTMGTDRSFSGYKAGQGAKLTIHLHLVPTSKTRGAISPPPPSWRAQGKLYLHLLIFVYKRKDRWFSHKRPLGKHRHVVRISRKKFRKILATEEDVRYSSRAFDEMKVAGQTFNMPMWNRWVYWE